MKVLSFTAERLNCHVTATIAEGINFALYQCRIPVIRQLSIRNAGNQATPKAGLAIAVEGFSDTWMQSLEPIRPGGSCSFDSLLLKLDYIRLEGLETKIETNLKIWIDQDLVFQCPIEILGFYEWPLSAERALQKSIACFVQPANPVIQRIVLDAAGSLRETSDFVSFKNLVDSPYSCKTHLALKTLYESISAAYQIHYVESPAWSYECNSQVIRPPHRVLPQAAGTTRAPGQGEGTCIDLSLLLAACLENINLQPILIFVQTSEHVLHAFLGCWQNKPGKPLDLFIDFRPLKHALEQDHLVVVETTGLSNHHGEKLSYAKAVEKAKTYLPNVKNFAFAIDISVARENNIFPSQFAMSPAVTAIIRNAEMLALRQKDLRLESGHLVFSFFSSDVLNHPELVASFSRAGIDLAAVRSKIASMIEYYSGPPKTTGPDLLRKTRNYRHIIEDATAMARESANGLVGRPQLLLAILQSRSARVQEILDYAGIDADQLVSSLTDTFRWIGQITVTDHKMAREDREEQPADASARFGAIDFRLCRLTADQFENIDLDFELPDQLLSGNPIAGTPFRVGDYLGDRWLILDLVGKGGMGTVYLVLDMPSGEKIAVKTIRDKLRGKTGIQERFIHEAKIWMQISQSPHLHILKLKKILQVANRIYIGMEYVPPPTDAVAGSTLRDWLLKFRGLEDRRIFQWSLQLCAGMIHALDQGMKCHSDIRPENIFIDRELNLKLADFGLALAAGAAPDFSGPAGHFAYMAPERFARSGPPDEITDIYSFGVILFEMVNGRRPIATAPEQLRSVEAQMKLWAAAHMETPRPPDKSPFATIIHKCLSTARSGRYRNFQEIAEDLNRLGRQLGCALSLKNPTRHATSVQAIATRGLNFLELRMHKEAIECFDRALARRKTNLTALNGKGFSLLGLGRHDEAGRIFDDTLTRFPNDLHALIGKSASLIKGGDYKPAAACLDRVLSVQPRIAVLWYHRADIYLRNDDRKRALACIYTALELLISQKRQDEALEIAVQGLSHFPTDLRLLQLQGWAHRLAGPGEEDLLTSKQKFEKLFDRQKTVDAETAGLLAGTYKRLWALNPLKYIHLLQKAFDVYHHAWGESNHNNRYLAINAASVALLLGKPELSRKIAADILKRYPADNLARLPQVGYRFSSYWYRAIQAEAELLLGHFGRAGRRYADITALYQTKRAYIESALNQLDLILPRLGLSVNAVNFLRMSSKSALRARRICFGVIGCFQTGYPQNLADQVKHAVERVREELGDKKDKIDFEVFSALANISEKIAAKVLMTEYQAFLKVVLPSEVEVCLRSFEQKTDVQWFWNHSEEMTILSTTTAPVQEWSAVHDYIANNCDILIAIADEKGTQESLSLPESINFARKNKAPIVLVDQNPDGRLSYDNFQQIKRRDYVKGGDPMYDPQPMDTSHVDVSEDMLDLTELLAQNAHDVWARKRLDEGWRYGPDRDDQNQKHPDLVPYSELPSSEKDYDRKMAMETLKVMVALGYRVQKDE